MNEPELSAVLHRATDHLDPTDQPHHAATSALARARVVRNRRRGLVAGAVAAVAVLAIALAAGTQGGNRSVPPVAPPTRTVPAIEASVVQTTWDPGTATALPQRESSLPVALEPPADAVSLPLATVAQLVLRDPADGLFLLGTDGSWAKTETPSGSAFMSVLSDDGTMLANLGTNGLFVTDVRDGTWRELDLPESPPGFWTSLGVSVGWQGNDRILLQSFMGVGVVDVEGERPPAVESYETDKVVGVDAAPDGRLLVFGSNRKGNSITELEEGELLRSFSAGELPSLHLPIATDQRVVGVVNGIPQPDRPTEHSGVMVLDRDGYAASAYLPIAGTRYTPGIDSTGFGAGDISPLAWLDERTVLLAHVGSTGRPWSLVAWDVESGDLTLVSRGGPDTQPASLARDLVTD